MLSKFQLSTLVALLSGAVCALSVRYYFAAEENVLRKGKFLQQQRVLESFEPRLAVKRQQLQAQQEKLSRSRGMADEVGGKVLADVAAFADRTNSSRLKDLLTKHGFALGTGVMKEGVAK
jgi:hypothetical protein